MCRPSRQNTQMEKYQVRYRGFTRIFENNMFHTLLLLSVAVVVTVEVVIGFQFSMLNLRYLLDVEFQKLNLVIRIRFGPSRICMSKKILLPR